MWFALNWGRTPVLSVHPLGSVLPFSCSMEDKATGEVLGSWWRTHQELHQGLKTASALLFVKWKSRKGSGCSFGIRPSVFCTRTQQLHQAECRSGTNLLLQEWGSSNDTFFSLSLLILGSYQRTHFQLRIRVNEWQHFGTLRLTDHCLLLPPHYTEMLGVY